jgi:hypothetical protein
MRFVATDQEFTRIEALRMLTMHGLLVNIQRAAANADAPTAPEAPLSGRGRL